MNLLFIPLTIGLPAIDESLEKLLTAMETFPNVAVLGDAVSMAKALGLCLALCVGSYECWMMMLGRRGMDVMKLLRIIGISLCISSSSWICSALQVPGKSLESATWAMAKAKNKEVAAFELKVAQKQSEYLDRLRTVQDSIATAKQVPKSVRMLPGGTSLYIMWRIWARPSTTTHRGLPWRLRRRSVNG